MRAQHLGGRITRSGGYRCGSVAGEPERACTRNERQNAMRVLSVRLDDVTYAQAERARLDAGLTRTVWLRSAVEDAVTASSQPRPPDEMALDSVPTRAPSDSMTGSA